MAKTKPTLEDYIFDMETRPPDRGGHTEQDLWSQLEKKESDLLLAAELGKALLEKNEELMRHQERLIEEYSAKLEVSRIEFTYQIQYLSYISFCNFHHRMVNAELEFLLPNLELRCITNIYINRSNDLNWFIFQLPHMLCGSDDYYSSNKNNRYSVSIASLVMKKLINTAAYTKTRAESSFFSSADLI